MALTLLAAVWAFSIQERTVTYHGPADRLEVILAEVGKQLGENLQPTPKLADVPVFLRCDKQPAAVVYQQLASLVNGRWERDSVAYRLTRDSRDVVNEQRTDLRRSSELITKVVKKRQVEALKMERFDEAQASSLVRQLQTLSKELDPNRQDNKFYERVNALEQKGPGARAVKRILAAINPALVASLPQKIKVVYSDKPNASQYELPSEVLPLAQQAINEHNLFAQVARQKDLKPPQINGGDYAFTQLIKETEPVGRGHRIWLSMYCSPGELLQVDFKVLNSKGRAVIMGSDYISLLGALEDSDRNWWEDQPAKEGEKTITIAPERKALVEAFRLSPKELGGEGIPTLNELGRNAALNIDTIEPAGYGLTDVLGQIVPDGPLLAICDDMTLFMAIMRGNAWTVESVRKILSLFNELRVVDGWTQLRPTMMGKYFAEKLGRVWQAKILRTMAKKPNLSIEEQAEIAYLVGDKEFDVLTMILGQRLRDQPEPMMMNNSVYYRLYGSMSDSQRQQGLKEGVPIRLLGRDQVGILRRIIFGQNANINVDYQGANPDEDSTSLASFDWEAFYNGIGREPTEIFPDGIPSDGLIKLAETSAEVVVPVRGSSPLSDQGEQSAEEFARDRFYRSRPEIFTWIKSTDTPPSKFRFAKRRQISVELVLKKGLKVSDSLVDKSFVINSPVAYSGLPANFRAKVDEVMAKMKEQYKGAKPGQYGSAPARGSTIPPLL